MNVSPGLRLRTKSATFSGSDAFIFLPHDQGNARGFDDGETFGQSLARGLRLFQFVFIEFGLGDAIETAREVVYVRARLEGA